MQEQSVVWITGCASGVGRHLADAFQRRGWRVLATDLNEVGLAQAAQNLHWPEDRVWTQVLDVRDRSAWTQLDQALAKRWGRLDLLINNAGYIRPGFLTETPDTELDLHLDINLKGVIHGSQIGAQRMLEAGRGHILNIASLAGVAPVRGLGLYSTAKFGVRAFSIILAQELASQGISVTTLCPDLIRTAMFDKQLDYQKEAALTFSGSVLQVEDIERVVFEHILPNKPIEVVLPGYRGWLAKFGNLMPEMSGHLVDLLGRLGEKRLAKARQKYRGNGR